MGEKKREIKPVEYNNLTGKVVFKDTTLFMGMSQPHIFREGDSVVFPISDLEMAYILESIQGLPMEELRSLEF